MERRRVNLHDEFERQRPGIVCLVGGGGKTALLLALGASIACSGLVPRKDAMSPASWVIPVENPARSSPAKPAALP